MRRISGLSLVVLSSIGTTAFGATAAAQAPPPPAPSIVWVPAVAPTAEYGWRSLFSDGSAVYAVGGTTDAGSSPAQVERRDPVTGEWVRLPDLALPVVGGGVAQRGQTLIVAGGVSPGLNEVATVQSLALGEPGATWRTDELPPLPVPIAPASLLARSGELFVSGAYTTAKLVNGGASWQGVQLGAVGRNGAVLGGPLLGDLFQIGGNPLGGPVDGAATRASGVSFVTSLAPVPFVGAPSLPVGSAVLPGSLLAVVFGSGEVHVLDPNVFPHSWSTARSVPAGCTPSAAAAAGGDILVLCADGRAIQSMTVDPGAALQTTTASVEAGELSIAVATAEVAFGSAQPGVPATATVGDLRYRNTLAGGLPWHVSVAATPLQAPGGATIGYGALTFVPGADLDGEPAALARLSVGAAHTFEGRGAFSDPMPVLLGEPGIAGDVVQSGSEVVLVTPFDAGAGDYAGTLQYTIVG